MAVGKNLARKVGSNGGMAHGDRMTFGIVFNEGTTPVEVEFGGIKTLVHVERFI